MKTILLSMICFCFSLSCYATENTLGQKTYAITCVTGKNLMPHHGLCLESANPNKSCTDEAYIDAIKYMADIK